MQAMVDAIKKAKAEKALRDQAAQAEEEKKRLEAEEQEKK